MELVHNGFDGLDISYPLTLPFSLAEKMRALKEQAAASRDDKAYLFHEGLIMSVDATGARGGFAYRCDTGYGTPYGETWFFKHPRSNKDPWGVRVSCKALPLALHGLKAVRAGVEDTLAKLGLRYVAGTESIGRIDFAMDFLAPELMLVPNNFVMHARCSRADHAETESITSHGHSGQVTSVTIGRNPGRQVIVYDKRAEAISQRKPYWWTIWNATRALAGRPPLDKGNRRESQVWRVELRAHKRHLKDGWHVTTWGDLMTMLPHILDLATSEIRYTVPGADINRSRWANHPLWVHVREEISSAMDDLCSSADPLTVQQVIIAERAAMLERQIIGCLLSRTVLLGATQEDLPAAMTKAAEEMIDKLLANPKWLAERFRAALEAASAFAEQRPRFHPNP